MVPTLTVVPSRFNRAHAHTPRGCRRTYASRFTLVMTSLHHHRLLFQLGQILSHKLADSNRRLRIMYVPSVEVLDQNQPSPWNACNRDRRLSLKDGLAEYCKRMRVVPHEMHVIDPRESAVKRGAESPPISREMDLRGTPLISSHVFCPENGFLVLLLLWTRERERERVCWGRKWPLSPP